MKTLEQRETKWKNVGEQIERLLSLENNQIVRFDVGGKKFASYLETLKLKESLFSKMIDSGNFDLGEVIYFDRCPKHFPTLLNFLRTGKINYKKFKKEELAELLDEAEYFEIGEVAQHIEDLKKHVEFVKMEYSGSYTYNGQTAGTGKLDDLKTKNLNVGVCANSPGWIILELNATWEFDEMEVAGFNGNSSLWYNANGAGAKIQTSTDKTQWKTVGTIPSNFGGSIQKVKLTMSTAKYIKFDHTSYLGLGYVYIIKKKY